MHYISPEQASGAPVNAPSDLYSVGVILYEMITNQLPFDAENAVAVACMQISTPPVHPSNIIASIPKGLEQIILKAMNKRPADRFENAAQMLTCLQRLEATPDAVFDFILVSENVEETVITKSTTESSEIDSVNNEIKADTQASASKAKTKKKKREKIVEVEVINQKSRVSMFPIIFGMLCAFCAVLLVVLIYVLQNYFFTENGWSIWGCAYWKRTAMNREYPFDYADNDYIKGCLKDNLNDFWYKTVEGYCGGKLVDNHVPGGEYFHAVNSALFHRRSIVPTKNMIKNIGFDGTHFNIKDKSKAPSYMNLDTYEIEFPIKHPKYVIDDKHFGAMYDKLLNHDKKNPVKVFLWRVRHFIELIFKGKALSAVKSKFQKKEEER